MLSTHHYGALQGPEIQQLSTSVVDSEQAGGGVDMTDRIDSFHTWGKKLESRIFSDWLPLLIQVLLAILPLLFIALGVVSISLDKKSISRTGQIVEAAIRVSPTAFPIAFAAITGKLFRAVSLYLVQRGTRLGTIERLVGSQSLFSSIERQTTLKGSYLLGLGIIFLWGLSPIGGQSALNLLHRIPRTVTSTPDIRYEPIQAYQGSTIDGADSADMFMPQMAPLFMAALLSAHRLQNSSEDMYGNIRIPSLTQMNPIALDWVYLETNQSVPFVSLLGIPVVGIPATGNASFSLMSEYLAVQCSSIVRYNASDNETYWIPLDSAVLTLEMSLLAETWQNGDNTTSVFMPFNLTSQIPGSNGSIGSFADCIMTPRAVQSNVICRDNACAVEAIRNSDDAGAGQYIDSVMLANMLACIPTATAAVSDRGNAIGSSLVESYLQDPSVAYNPLLSVDISQIPLKTFSQNLESVINTFWQTTYLATLLTGNLGTNLSDYDNVPFLPGSPVANDSFDHISFNTTTIQLSQFDGQEYVCNRVFAAILLIVSGILLVEALATLVLMTLTLVPDILGYVSSSTRDNPYVISSEASYLDGLERAAAMKDIRVIVGDVNSKADVGHIALSSMMDTQPLQKGRFYD